MINIKAFFLVRFVQYATARITYRLSEKVIDVKQ